MLPLSLDFLVISVVACAKAPDSYNLDRSKYSATERLEQTLETIRSIRTYAPSSRILLIEGGYKFESLSKIEALVDEYYFIGNKRFVRLAVDSRHKTLGELALMILALIALRRSNADLVLKISGRYCINKNFILDGWDSNRFNFKLSDRNVSSRLYGFPRSKRLQLLLSLCWGCIGAARGKRMEQILHRSLFTHPRSYISTLGLEGKMGPTGKRVEE